MGGGPSSQGGDTALPGVQQELLQQRQSSVFRLFSPFVEELVSLGKLGLESVSYEEQNVSDQSAG